MREYKTGIATRRKPVNMSNLAHDRDLRLDCGWYLSDWSNSKIGPEVGFEPTTLGFCIRRSPNRYPGHDQSLKYQP